MFDKHFPALLEKPDFRRLLQEDANLGLRLLDLFRHEAGLGEKKLGTCAQCGQAKLCDADVLARLDSYGEKPTCTRSYGEGRYREQCGGIMKINRCWIKQD